jgi:secretion/DNA translocation related TadE-like protein
VCLLAVGLVLLLSGLFGATAAAARVARQRASVAADFGALAAAARVLAGERVACAEAVEIVRANGARLVGCWFEGLDALVTAELTVRLVPGLDRPATATSRAGPLRG